MSVGRTLARGLGKIIQVAVPLTILVLAVLVAWKLINSRPEIPKTEFKRSAFLVETQPLEFVREREIIRAFGNVRPHREATLQAEVQGRIVRQHEQLVLGGLIPKGEELIGLDPRDYELAIEQSRGDIARAELDLQLELGQQQVAKREWTLLGDSVPNNPLGRSLALREPQIKERRAALETAKSRLRQAELALERTSIRAPFNALVLDESAETGELVAQRNSIARLACTDEFHVEVNLPLRDLDAVATLVRRGESPRVRVLQDVGRAEKVEFSGRIFKLLGALQPDSRMARILVEVTDPLRLASEDPGAIPLLLGSYVEVQIDGPSHDEAVLLSRLHLRAGDQAWVLNADDRLDIRELQIADRRRDHVVVVGGLGRGEHLVTSAIPTPVAGMQLRRAADEKTEASEEPEPEPASTEEGAQR
jgi:RND family efflux transporter MFP subunit